MAAALFWGAVAGSSLVLGALIAIFTPVSLRLLGLVMAFGAGVLISAVAYELVSEAFDTADGPWASRSDSSPVYDLLRRRHVHRPLRR